LKRVSRFAPGAQEYPFGSGIGILGSGLAIAEVVEAVVVLVKIVWNVLVEDNNVVVATSVRVVARTSDKFVLALTTICSGHN
jgi:hypothetical protein